LNIECFFCCPIPTCFPRKPLQAQRRMAYRTIEIEIFRPADYFCTEESREIIFDSFIRKSSDSLPQPPRVKDTMKDPCSTFCYNFFSSWFLGGLGRRLKIGERGFEQMGQLWMYFASIYVTDVVCSIVSLFNE